MQCPKCQTNNPSDSKFCKECATPLPAVDDARASFTKTLETPAEELARGVTFAGRYEIIEELGKGGMGRVFRAEDTKLKQQIALKLIKTEIAADKKIIERFRNELKTARMIAHPNVCRMFDLGEEKGTHFITMEYVPGEDLKTMIRMSGKLGVGTAVNIARQVCAGLAEAHKLNIIHRDLKPNNIMIDKDGHAHIMDFGIARSLEVKGTTGAGVMIGTPEYMSPEQVEGKEVDQRSDIYALGIILYEMLTGRVPFEGDTSLSVALKHKIESPQDPRDITPQIPEDLGLIVLRCLEKSKEKRYQGAKELQGDLDRIEKALPLAEKVPSKGEKELAQEHANTQTIELHLDIKRNWDDGQKHWKLPPALAHVRESGYILKYNDQVIPRNAYHLSSGHLVVTNNQYCPSQATDALCVITLPARGVIYDKYRQRLLLAIAMIVPALLLFLLINALPSKHAVNIPSSSLTLTISGRPLASYPFYPIDVSKEGYLYIDKGKFMDAVNALRQKPDIKAVADLVYLERRENITLQLGESERGLFQKLLKEVPVPDLARQEAYLDRLFEVYKQIVNGIGQTFAGTPIEIVLHDVRDPMHSIQALQNPISGRQLGQPTTNFGVELIKWYAVHPQQFSNFISYDLKLADGTPIKSSTIPLFDPEYGYIGGICLNIRISDISETNLDEKTRQFLSAFRKTLSNSEIEEIVDNAKRNLSSKSINK
jgi:serine/threonine protein kinase/predicted transcriptional regulator YheO